MNCKDFKNLISELGDIDQVGCDLKLSEHISDCENCRSFVKYEQKLRLSFSVMAKAPIPEGLSEQIFAIPQNTAIKNEKTTTEISLFTQFYDFISSFSFKLALGSAFTGFLIAAMIFKSPTGLKTNETITNASTSVQSITEIASSPASQQNQTIEQPQLTIANKPDDSKTIENKIPGAVSFSLTEEASIASSVITTHREAQQASNISLSRNGQIAIDTSYNPPTAPVHQKNEKITTSTAISLTPPKHAVEILTFLQSNGLAEEEGFIDLETLAMRGYIATKQVREWQPKDGNSWFLSKDNGKPTLSLRRKP